MAPSIVSEPSQPSSGEITPVEAARAPGKAMGFWDHLNELRGVLFRCALSFLAAAIVVGVYFQEFYAALSWPLHHVLADYPGLEFRLVTNSPMDVFNIIIQLCLVGGLVMSSPLILFFIGQFVAPALTEQERRSVLPFVGSGLFLFLAGCSFSFYLLVTSTLRVSIELNSLLGLGFNWTPINYFKLMTWLVLGVGFSFEFPLVIVLLVKFGLMTTAFLRKYRRHAIVVIFIIAAIVTPTPDPFVQAMFAAPLYILYEIAILAGRRIEKKREAKLAAGL
jgi:sec-independent protein translocase protein TatC